MDAGLENPFSNKTLVGNWKENRDLNGLVSVPARGHVTLATHRDMTERNPVSGFPQIRAAGFSRAAGGDMGTLDRTFSSLSLKSLMPPSDNTYLTTCEKSYNRARCETAIGYGTRNWKIIKGHWLPEAVDTSTHRRAMQYGVLDGRKAAWKKQQDELNWAKINKPTTYTHAYKDPPRTAAYPSRVTKTTLDRSTQMYPINKWHRDFVLREKRLVNVVPDIAY